jgi:hypothetical protein
MLIVTGTSTIRKLKMKYLVLNSMPVGDAAMSGLLGAGWPPAFEARP